VIFHDSDDVVDVDEDDGSDGTCDVVWVGNDVRRFHPFRRHFW
jgi:hypothetical protein